MSVPRETEGAETPLPERVGRRVEAVASAAICAFVLYTIAVGRLASDLQNAIVLTLVVIAVLGGRGWRADGRHAWIDACVRVLLVIGAVGSGVYFMTNYEAIAAFRSGLPNSADLLCYAAGLVVVIEAARRSEGWLFTSVVLVFLAYLLFGHLIPGILGHRRFGLEETLELAYSTQAIYGIAFTSVVNVVYVFVILGVALRVTGAGDFFNFIAEKLTRGMRSGPAQCAVVASALFGSINGSAPANVASTGVLTIPMMKRAGFPAPFAAGVEASASCVGQLLPPVMGVGAFIMSELTGVPYLEIMLAAVVPALLFIGAIAVSVALEARRLDITPRVSAEAPRWTPIRRAQGLVLAGAFATLLTMLFSGFSATYSGFGATVATLALAMAFPGLRLDLDGWRRLFVEGGRDGLSLAIACAAIGVVIAGVTATGLGVKLNQAIAALGGSSLPLALLLAALCSIVIGMGLPTAAAYLTVVFIAGPAIIALGVGELQAHLFVFYYAVLSAITPPVALALFAAAAIAGTSPMRAAGPVMRLSFVGFLLPIAWIYHPELTFGAGGGTPLDAAVAFGQFAAAIGCASAGFAGVARGPLAAWERLALLAAGALVVWPNAVATAVGLAIGAVVLARQFRSSLAPSVTETTP